MKHEISCQLRTLYCEPFLIRAAAQSTAKGEYYLVLVRVFFILEPRKIVVSLKFIIDS